MFFKKLSLPYVLIIVICGALFFGTALTIQSAQAFYTFSMVFKEILGFFLPFIIFSFIFAGILSFKKSAPLVVGILLALIIASNICVSLSAFSLGRLFLPLLTAGTSPESLLHTSNIQPLFPFYLPPLIASEKAMIGALLLGFVFSLFSFSYVEKIAFTLKGLVEVIMNSIFVPLLPLYVFGFLVKIVQEGTFYSLFTSYGKAFLLILSVQALISSTWYLIAAGGKLQTMVTYMRVAFTSYLTAFSTMSSTSAIPITLQTTAKNSGNQPLSNVAIPIMANVHLMGDAITIPIFSLVTMALFSGSTPSYASFFMFTLYFCMAMLATAGVPGGGIIMVIPVLKSVLNFTPEMISVITALYLLQDSFGTGCNVFGDGALTIIADKLLKKLKILPH